MVLWRKIRKDMIQVACYLCDIALMMQNPDVNLMAVFCLSQLTENEKSHKFLFKTMNPKPKAALGLRALLFHTEKKVSNFDHEQNNGYSIFSRINHLLDTYESIDYRELNDAKAYKKNLTSKFGSNTLETNISELLMNLVVQMYLNLSRNEANTEKLIELKLFKRVKEFIDKFL